MQVDMINIFQEDQLSEFLEKDNVVFDDLLTKSATNVPNLLKVIVYEVYGKIHFQSKELVAGVPR